MNRAGQRVDISAVLALDDKPDMRNALRAERIADAARQAVGSWNVLFVHSDGKGDPESAVRERIAPALARLRDAGMPHAEGVAVVPVRETEAWLLTDGDVLRSVFGVSLDDEALGLPSSATTVVSISDPKLRLALAFVATRPSGKRARAGPAASFNALGEQVSLERLRAVPSFRALEVELIGALERLHILRP